MKKSSLLPLALAPLLLAACAGPSVELPAQNRLESYAFDPASPLESRITAPPKLFLDFFRVFDERPDYRSYEPTPADRAMVMDYLRLLPPVYEKTFRERCVGIHFVPDMVGNGLADWIVGPEGRIYFHLMLNPTSMTKTITETLSERERSAFIPAKGWSLEVEAGARYKGLLYALLHEGAHCLDYALEISPYTDEGMPPAYRPARPALRDFFMSSWSGYSRPLPARDFPGRGKVSFYGLGGGPKLGIAEAADLYRGLAGSGFASLYGAQSWGEDLADLATFSILTEKLGQPYAVTVISPGGSSRLEPLSGPAGGRAKTLLKYLEDRK